jgi:hypothetical protein
MSILDPGHSWNEIKSELEKLSSSVPAGEILELVLHCKSKRYMMKFLDESSGSQDRT